MVASLPKLSWMIVQKGKDSFWWVKEVSEDVYWDPIDARSVLDPQQAMQVWEAAKPLERYGIHAEDWQNAFFRFRIDKRLGEHGIRLVRTEERWQQTEKPMFLLPKIIDPFQNPYMDFVDALLQARVKYLNATIDFAEKLSVDEVKNLLHEGTQLQYFEGVSLHVFPELMEILEYVPSGFENDLESGENRKTEDFSSEIEEQEAL
ncbi:MAG: hypothetical protein J6Z25_02300 [Opitutales bacterium]|nr:hypothetical protein [Opitutales bacterium]